MSKEELSDFCILGDYCVTKSGVTYIYINIKCFALHEANKQD